MVSFVTKRLDKVRLPPELLLQINKCRRHDLPGSELRHNEALIQQMHCG